jgi:hypothetical protein
MTSIVILQMWSDEPAPASRALMFFLARSV